MITGKLVAGYVLLQMATTGLGVLVPCTKHVVSCISFHLLQEGSVSFRKTDICWWLMGEIDMTLAELKQAQVKGELDYKIRSRLWAHPIVFCQLVIKFGRKTKIKYSF